MNAVDADGRIIPEVQNKAVSSSLLREIHSWTEAGASSDDVIDHLRLRCVPYGFTPHPWIPGTCTWCILVYCSFELAPTTTYMCM